MPLVRRVPKRGFHNRFAATVATVNLSDLESAFEAGEEVTPESLREKSLVAVRSEWKAFLFHIALPFYPFPPEAGKRLRFPRQDRDRQDKP